MARPRVHNETKLRAITGLMDTLQNVGFISVSNYRIQIQSDPDSNMLVGSSFFKSLIRSEQPKLFQIELIFNLSLSKVKL